MSELHSLSTIGHQHPVWHHFVKEILPHGLDFQESDAFLLKYFIVDQMSSQDVDERPNDEADKEYLRMEILDVPPVSQTEAELQQPPCEKDVVPPEEPVFVYGMKPDKIECQQRKADNVVKIFVSVDTSIVTDVRTHPCVAHSIPR
jgi:hypothetical protein